MKYKQKQRAIANAMALYKMGSIDKALPHAGFYPDSQNVHSDAAKIGIFLITSKLLGAFLLILSTKVFLVQMTDPSHLLNSIFPFNILATFYLLFTFHKAFNKFVPCMGQTWNVRMCSCLAEFRCIGCRCRLLRCHTAAVFLADSGIWFTLSHRRYGLFAAKVRQRKEKSKSSPIFLFHDVKERFSNASRYLSKVHTGSVPLCSVSKAWVWEVWDVGVHFRLS